MIQLEIVEPGDNWTNKQAMFAKGVQKPFAFVWQHYTHDIRVLRSVASMAGGTQWLHVSVSKKAGEPSWKTMQGVKNQFIGTNQMAIQVFPNTRGLIDIANVYHLWCPLGGWVGLPNLNEIILEEAT